MNTEKGQTYHKSKRTSTDLFISVLGACLLALLVGYAGWSVILPNPGRRQAHVSGSKATPYLNTNTVTGIQQTQEFDLLIFSQTVNLGSVDYQYPENQIFDSCGDPVYPPPKAHTVTFNRALKT